MDAVVQRGSLLPHQLQVGEPEYPLLLVLAVERRPVPEREPQVRVVEVLDRDLHLICFVYILIISYHTLEVRKIAVRGTDKAKKNFLNNKLCKTTITLY